MEEPVLPNSAPGGALTPFPAPAGATPPRVVCLEPVDFLADPQAKAKTLADYWQLVRFHWWMILLLSLAGAAAGALATFSQVPVYQAVTSLEVQNPVDNPANRLGDKDLGGAAGYPSEPYLQTIVQILQSRAVRQRVWQKLQLEKRQMVVQELDALAVWHKLTGQADGSGIRVERLQRPRVVAQAKAHETSRVVDITCDSPDAKLAADYANAMASEFIEYNLEARWETAQHAADWFGRQLEELRGKLQNSQGQLQRYSRSTGLIFTADKEDAEMARLIRLQDELSKAQAIRVGKQSVYEAAATTPPDAVPQVIDNVRLSDYQVQIADLRRQMAELSSPLTPEHYRVKRVQAQIDELEKTLQRERESVLTRIRSEYEAALRQEKLLSDAYRAQVAAVSDRAGKAINYNILQREVEINSRLYEALLQRLRETSIATALRASNLRVIDTARVPDQPFRSNSYRDIGLGLLAGMALAFGFVVTREQIDRTLKSPGDTSFHLKLPELGVIPNEKCNGERSLGSQHMLSLRLKGGPADPAEEDCVELITWQQKHSLVAESFRNTLASILFSNQQGKRPQVILVSSCSRGEGKTTTTCNLGIALAEINQKVVLIDADTRKSALHGVFHLPNTWGLSDLLREQMPLAESPLEALARPTSIAGLHVLPSGPPGVNMINLLYSNRMRQLIQRFRGVFDVVLIDTPPLLAVPDARVLGRLADAAVLVVRAGRTTRDAAAAAKKRFEEDSIPLLGTILNGWNPKSKSYHYYYYEGRYEPPEAVHS